MGFAIGQDLTICRDGKAISATLAEKGMVVPYGNHCLVNAHTNNSHKNGVKDWVGDSNEHFTRSLSVRRWDL
jgi:hypothetical protein